jgi:hypothetical protein
MQVVVANLFIVEEASLDASKICLAVCLSEGVRSCYLVTPLRTACQIAPELATLQVYFWPLKPSVTAAKCDRATQCEASFKWTQSISLQRALAQQISCICVRWDATRVYGMGDLAHHQCRSLSDR